MKFIYRIQVIHNYKYYDDVFPSIKALLDEYSVMLDITRAQVSKMIKQDATVNRHPHILITREEWKE